MNTIAKLALAAGLLTAALASAQPALAKDKGTVPIAAVLKACDNTPGCDYHNTGSGISGCSKNACFECGKEGCVGIPTHARLAGAVDRTRLIGAQATHITSSIHVTKPAAFQVVIAAPKPTLH